MTEILCTCAVEGVRAVEARRLRIFHCMGLEYMEDLTTAIILSLAFDFQAWAHIDADMWFGVSVNTALLDKSLYIECDWPGDGLAALWEELAKEFPERVSVRRGTDPACGRFAERVSAALFSNYESDYVSYQEHRAAARKDNEDASHREDCRVFRHLSSIAHQALEEVWGSRVLEQAVEQLDADDAKGSA